MRVVNINTKDVRWVTLAHITQVESKFLETLTGPEMRAELLQRILHLAFGCSMLASHSGAWLNLPGGVRVRFSPRALLYVCDEPEERALMCLKRTGCLFPCTPCMVGQEDSCSASGADAPSRDVQETVRAQLKNATMGAFWGAAARRAEVESEHSLNSAVPAIFGRRAHPHLDVIFGIAPHLERSTRHRDGSLSAPKSTCLHLVVIFLTLYDFSLLQCPRPRPVDSKTESVRTWPPT